MRLRTAYDAPVRRLRLPMPGLVFVCLPARQSPDVFAATVRPTSPTDQLYHPRPTLLGMCAAVLDERQ